MESVQYKLTAINIPCKLLKFPAPQESFYGHMKDHINEKLAPNEFYQFYTTGIYPLDASAFKYSLRENKHPA